VLKMLFKHDLANLIQGALHGIDLLNHIDAICIIFKHALHGFHVTFDDLHAADRFCFWRCVHINLSRVVKVNLKRALR